MKCIVLSAGLGTRLGALTREIPKPMLPLSDRPLLEWTIANLVSQGVTDLAINLHYRPEVISQHFGDGSRFGATIHYSSEPELMGTAGAVKNFAEWIDSDAAFLVLYGDILTDQKFTPLWEAQRDTDALAALAVHRRVGSNSVIAIDENSRITQFVERPPVQDQQSTPDSWVNSGIQVLSRRILDLIPAGRKCDLPRDVYVPYHQAHTLIGVPLSGYRCAIDSAERYHQAEEALRDGDCRISVSPA